MPRPKLSSNTEHDAGERPLHPVALRVLGFVSDAEYRAALALERIERNRSGTTLTLKEAADRLSVDEDRLAKLARENLGLLGGPVQIGTGTRRHLRFPSATLPEWFGRACGASKPHADRTPPTGAPKSRRRGRGQRREGPITMAEVLRQSGEKE